MRIIITLGICSLTAALFFAIQTERIIFNTPGKSHVASKQTQTTACTLYWHDNMLQPETKQIMHNGNAQEHLAYIINTWLLFLYNEDVHKKVHAETVMLSPAGNELFISFDRNPFNKQQAIHEKLGFIESLFKTIRPHTAARKVRFLVRHAPMCDAHLDFSCGWDV